MPLGPDRVVTGLAAGEQQHRVVRARAGVDDQRVERVPDAVLERGVERGGSGGGVGDDDGEHRRHRRSEHRRTLGHPADAEARSVGELGDHERLLADRVGREDRLGGRTTGDLVGAEAGHQAGDTRLDRCHRQGDADEPGRAHEHVVGGAAELAADQLARPLGVGSSGCARGRVGVPRVQHDGGRVTGAQGAGDSPARARRTPGCS